MTVLMLSVVCGERRSAVFMLNVVMLSVVLLSSC
jgi:hypothetical protein